MQVTRRAQLFQVLLSWAICFPSQFAVTFSRTQIVQIPHSSNPKADFSTSARWKFKSAAKWLFKNWTFNNFLKFDWKRLNFARNQPTEKFKFLLKYCTFHSKNYSSKRFATKCLFSFRGLINLLQNAESTGRETGLIIMECKFW